MPGRRPPPRSPRRVRSSRLSAATILVVTLALLAGACGWTDGDPAATTLPGEDPSQRIAVSPADLGPFDVDTEGLAAAGTPLGGGLDVPEGAVLLGIPFPDLEGGGFRALMLVTGDPVATYNAMVSQAVSMGMERSGTCVGAPQSLTCNGRFVDEADGESLVIDVRQVVTGFAAASGLAVHYRPPGSEDLGSSPGATDASTRPTEPLAPVGLPDTVPPPPDEDVGIALRGDGPVVSVEVGSTLVGLPGPCGCDGTGWSFVVSVQGRMRDVIAAYGRQFSELGEPPDVSDRYRGDQTSFNLRVGEGDEFAEIRAVAPDRGVAYLLVTVVEG